MSEQKIIARVFLNLCQKHMLQLLEKFPKANLSQLRDPYTCDVCMSSKNPKDPLHEAIVQARVSVEVVQA